MFINNKRNLSFIDKGKLIINLDETPLYFDAPFETTYEKKGAKNDNKNSRL